MDGDLRTRFPRPPVTGQQWGYSTALAADLSPGQPVRPAAEPPRAPAKALQDDTAKPAPKQDDSHKDDKDSGKDDSAPKAKMPRWKKVLFGAIGLCVLIALIVTGVIFYLDSRHYETTDDAFIDGHQSQVSAQVGAKVVKLAIQDNQQVRAGEPLLQLDPRDFQVKIVQAQAQRAQAVAQLEQAKAGLGQQQAQIDQAIANVRVAEADLGQQQTDLARYRAIDPKAITRQQLDNASAQTKSASARVDASRQAVDAARAQLEAQRAQVQAAAAAVQVSQAAIENAELQLSYTTIAAPASGRVTRRTVEVGNYVNPGQALLAIVPDDFWITANFKETQLADMRPGQHVRVRVDACPGIDLSAHVESRQSGTGAAFSSLPAENATGNYVKVVQRVPVKLVFDEKPDPGRCALGLGMSVAPRVTVR